MNRFLSLKFRFYSFVCIALLLLVHGYNLNITYLAPYSTVDEPLTLTTFIEYFLANGALRFRIPMLFIISGYIFALQDKKPYWQRIGRRVKTLIVPFLIWSAVGLLITYILQRFPVTAQAVRDAQLDQAGDNRPYEEIGWAGILHRWLLKPVSFQLWFIRSLFFYNMLYPYIKKAVSTFPMVWFVVVFLFWHTIFNIMFIEGQGLFYFSLGVWLNKSNFPIHKKPSWFSHYISWLFFLGIGVIKTFMAFELDPADASTFFILYGLHDISVASGILAVWYGGDAVAQWLMQKKWFVWVTAFSFIIYALHVPLINYATRLAFIYWHNVPNYRLITYIVIPTAIFFICIGVGALLRAAFPKVYRIATGGRGF